MLLPTLLLLATPLLAHDLRGFPAAPAPAQNVHKTNADRLAQGLAPLRPKRLYDGPRRRQAGGGASGMPTTTQTGYLYAVQPQQTAAVNSLGCMISDGTWFLGGESTGRRPGTVSVSLSLYLSLSIASSVGIVVWALFGGFLINFGIEIVLTRRDMRDVSRVRQRRVCDVHHFKGAL